MEQVLLATLVQKWGTLDDTIRLIIEIAAGTGALTAIIAFWHKIIAIPKKALTWINVTFENLQAMFSISSQLKNITSSLGGMSTKIDSIEKEVRPDGGHTLFDKVTRTDIRLYKMEQKMNRMDNSMNPNGSFETDIDGEWINCNEMLLFLTGRDKHEILGKGWFNCIIQGERTLKRKEWLEALLDGRDIELTFTIQHTGGYPINVILKAERMERGNKDFYGYQGSITRIEKQK